jgi:EpsI family protein
VAYYSSQRKGEAIHSPRSCLPGGGWRIKELSSRALSDVLLPDNRPLTVNRAVIQKGEYRQLVYYWFQQRGRNLTDEYVVKWYLFWDALNRNRSDGALVRLVVMVQPGQDLSEGDRQLTAFARAIVSPLGAYIPD